MGSATKRLQAWWKQLWREPPRSAREARPRLEALEDRMVPSGSRMLNLASQGASGAIAGALFQQGDPYSGDAGKLNPFLRLQNKWCQQTEQGYNTDSHNLQFNEVDRFTSALKLGDVRRVVVDGVAYREFVLDVNESRCRWPISLDQLRLYVGERGDLRGYNGRTQLLSGLHAVYDMDAQGDRWVKLDSRLARPGQADMVFLVPESVFGSAGSEAYVYLFSKFGEHFGADGGFEQWSTRASNTVTGSIFGSVFGDLNQNGGFDVGEQGAGGWVVWLDANNDGVLDANEQSTLTDATGNYSFTGLILGATYTVRVEDRSASGWIPTSENPLVLTLTSQTPSLTNENFGQYFTGANS